MLGHDVAGVVKPGQKVLVHAGADGLGSTIVQLAEHLGATVATTGSTDSEKQVRSLRADVVVDHKKEDRMVTRA